MADFKMFSHKEKCIGFLNLLTHNMLSFNQPATKDDNLLFKCCRNILILLLVHIGFTVCVGLFITSGKFEINENSPVKTEVVTDLHPEKL